MEICIEFFRRKNSIDEIHNEHKLINIGVLVTKLHVSVWVDYKKNLSKVCIAIKEFITIKKILKLVVHTLKYDLHMYTAGWIKLYTQLQLKLSAIWNLHASFEWASNRLVTMSSTKLLYVYRIFFYLTRNHVTWFKIYCHSIYFS